MKRIFDIVVASIILMMVSPLLILIMVVIKLCQRGPVFFKHARLGINNDEFYILKFCTMTDDRGEDGHWLPDKERTTRIGEFLRRTSLDEFPGFWNVLRGDMSLVGPRPLPPQYLNRYSKKQARRHDVKPGVTGFAQINGRNAISWERKFSLDVWYVDNQSFYLDIKILLKTVIYVLVRRDIVPENKGAMEEFMGSKTGDEL
jgi:sugar transferase EpsL